MLTKIIDFFVLCVVFEVYYVHSTLLADSNLLQRHFPSTLDNGNGEVINTEIGDLTRFGALEPIIMCGIFRGKTIEQENPEKVEYIQELAETNLILAIQEAARTFKPLIKNYETFATMEIEGTGLSKSLYHCPRLGWQTEDGTQPMSDFYITASDVEENVPLCFEKIDENTVALRAVEDEITLDKIPSVIEDLEKIFGNKRFEQAAVEYTKAGYTPYQPNFGGFSWDTSVPVAVAA